MRLASPWKQAVLALIIPGFIASAALAAPAGWALKYGSGQSEVGYYNAKINPKIEEASPLGPLAFRVVAGDLWIADSIGGRVLQLGPNGAVKAAMSVPGVGTDTLLEDLALTGSAPGKTDAVWVADGADLVVRKLSVPAGTELMRVGGRGENPGQFAQIHQVETGPTGKLYIGDYGRSMIAVFSPEGKLLREHPWERSGFAIDDRDRLSTVVFIDGAGYVWQRYDAEGRLERSVHLGLQALQNPRVWWNEADGGLSVSFIPAGGFRGSVTMHVFSADGAVLRKYPIRPAAGMNRYVDRDGSAFWTATANVDAAPAGAFRIESLTTDGEARPASKKQAADPWAALKITRDAVVKFPAIDPSTLIGIRTEGANGFLLSRDGTLTTFDLATGKTAPAQPLVTAGSGLLDFALVGGKPLALDTNGTLVGAKPANWPAGPFVACRIDVSQGEALLTGGPRSSFLAGNATSAVELPATCLAMPFREGFLWNLKRPGLRAWEALLMDGYGNLMKRVSKFTTEFDPTGLTFGPNGPEGELLISCFGGTAREVSLLGQNGRMLWKLPMQNAVAPRDLAWDQEGNLLVLERDGNGLVLNRITFAVPQG